MANNPQFSNFQPERPQAVGSTDPSRSYAHPVPNQPFPLVPAANAAFPGLPQPPQFHSSVLPPRPQYTVQNALLPPGMSVSNSQAINQVASESLYPQLIAPPPPNFVPPNIRLGAPLSSSFTFSPHGLQNQMNSAAPAPAVQYPPGPPPHVSSVSTGEQSRLASESLPGSSVKSVTAGESNVQPTPLIEGSNDWIEHTSPDGRRYYYNKKTKQSSWQKPFELMTAIERADATTDWREHKSADGRLYYYNKVTKVSKWVMPLELKLARERITKTDTLQTPSEIGATNEEAKSAVESSFYSEGTVSVPAPTRTSSGAAEPTIASTSPSVSTVNSASTLTASVNEVSPNHSKQAAVAAAETAEVASETISDVAVAMIDPAEVVAHKELNSSEMLSAPEKISEMISASGKASEMVSATENAKDDKKFEGNAEIILQDKSVSHEEKPEKTLEDKLVSHEEKAEKTLEDKVVSHEPLSYANKLEARDAFKALLEAANVGSDWTWERAMRVIITDKRYGALKSLGERKDTFNEFVSQKKKQEVEDRHNKQKKTREDFRKMLQEFKEVTSSSKWSKVVHLFENDARFKAIEHERDRKELFDDYLDELKEQEKVKAVEERKQNIMEYRQFLESCSFITANTQWRKVQDRLAADERCRLLEKIDRLQIFQEYIQHLSKEEEEQRKLQKEELRKIERKNRDEFRKLMEEHVESGMLTAKTHWREYSLKVKDLPAYVAVASNTSGATPNDLFDDVVEELEKQYEEDKAQIEGAVKSRKVDLSLTRTLEDFKAAIAEDLPSKPISDINFKLVFEHLVRKKEEKDAKKRKRMGDKLFDLFQSFKEISVSSTWEDCKHFVERSHEHSSIKDENFCREIFQEYITALKEKEKEYERRHKEEKDRGRERYDRERRREKDRRGKDRHDRDEKESRYGVDDDHVDAADSNASDKRKKLSSKDKERDKKHDKRRHIATDDVDETERDHSMKKHKREHRNGSHRSNHRDDLEDGEFGS